jgi:uncharacterized membrane protein YphA (DoxX/SURF4 family)
MKLPRYGFFSMMHEARADFSMRLGSLFLLIVDAGRWSLDAALALENAAPHGMAASPPSR